MSIDPEKLLDLAKKRHHDGGVTLGWPTVMQIVEGLRERNRLAIDVERLRAVAENMDHFNDGDDLADAEAALSDSGDTLDAVFARRDARIRAEVLWDMANRLRRDAEQIDDGCKASAVIEMAWRKLDNESARLYRQSEEAPCSSTSPSVSPSASC